jgi:hypothetical protein
VKNAEHFVLLPGNINQSRGIGDCYGKWFLRQNVFASKQGLLGVGEVGVVWRLNRYS